MRFLRRLGELAASLELAAMVILLETGVPGAISIVRHLTLWVAFLGGALAAREGRLLGLATGDLLPEGRLRSGGKLLASAIAEAVSALFFRAGIDLVASEFARAWRSSGRERPRSVPTGSGTGWNWRRAPRTRLSPVH